MARVRTIPRAVKEIKEKDPGSFINAAMLRRLVAEGSIPHIECGYKYILVDLDAVEKFLDGAGATDF